MSFLTPFFFWLIPLIGIPTLLHLWNQRRVTEINYSTLTFLRLMEKKSIRRVHLLEIILLILRTIIILLIVIMISRPVISGIFAGWVDNPASTITAILIDDTFSMSGKIENRTFKERLENVLKEINSTLDRRQIVILGTLSDGILYLGDGQSYFELNPEISFTYQNGEFGNLFYQVSDTIETDFVNREMYVISDFKSNSFKYSKEILTLLQTWNLFTIDMGSPLENMVISGITIENEIIVPNQPITITANVKNIGFVPQLRKMLTLEINGLDVAQQIIDLNSGEEKTFYFKTALPGPGNFKSRIYLEKDDQIGGNSSQFVLSIPKNVSIGIFSPTIQEITYLTNAFDALNNSGQILSYTIGDPNVLTEIPLDNFDVIIYNGALSNQIAEKLETYLNSGKHLMILPGQNETNIKFSTFSMDCPELEPDENSELYKEFHSDFKIGGHQQSVSHLLNMSQTEPRFFHSCSIIGSGSDHLVLEDQTVVWMRHYFNQSILDFVGFQFKPDWTNLPVLAGFLPFIHEWIYEGTSGKAVSYYAGESVSVKIDKENLTKKIILVNEENERKIVQGNHLNQTVNWITDKPGFFEMELDQHKYLTLAVNIHPEELSDSIISSQELNVLLPEYVAIKNMDQIIPEIQKARIGQEITHYFIIILFMLLFLEMGLAQLKNRQGKNH